MYRRILVALENRPADATVLAHVGELAGRLGSALLLVHVADGFAARNYDQLRLADSEEMRLDRAYLDAKAVELRARGLMVETTLALGSPPVELVRVADEEACDLIAMTTHGHRLIGDLFLGSTIDKVRHATHVPLLVVRGPAGNSPV